MYFAVPHLEDVGLRTPPTGGLEQHAEWHVDEKNSAPPVPTEFQPLSESAANED